MDASDVTAELKERIAIQADKVEKIKALLASCRTAAERDYLSEQLAENIRIKSALRLNLLCFEHDAANANNTTNTTTNTTTTATGPGGGGGGSSSAGSNDTQRAATIATSSPRSSSNNHLFETLVNETRQLTAARRASVSPRPQSAATATSTPSATTAGVPAPPPLPPPPVPTLNIARAAPSTTSTTSATTSATSSSSGSEDTEAEIELRRKRGHGSPTKPRRFSPAELFAKKHHHSAKSTGSLPTLSASSLASASSSSSTGASSSTTSAARKPDSDSIRREELQEKDAKDQLRTALEDIKLKILQQESIVERLKRELAALHPESAEYAQAKVKYEESMMVMYALQINVMVFRKYVDEEEQPPDNQPAVDGAAANAGDVQHPSGSQQQQQQQQQQQHNAAGNSFTQGHAPSSPASGQGSPSSSSAVAAIAAARQGSSSRLTNLSAAGGGSQSNVFSGIQTAAPGGRRGTLLRLQRPATGVSLQRTIILEHVPELRGRAVYQSACDNLNAIMQDISFSPYFKATKSDNNSNNNTTGYKLSSGTFDDIIMWIVYHAKLPGADNADLQALLLVLPSYGSVASILDSLARIQANFVANGYPRDIGATGYLKRLATFLDQLVRNLGSKLGAQEKEQVLQFVQAHFDDDRAKSIAKLIDQPPLRLEHIPGFPSFIGEPAAEQTAGSPITKPVTTTAGMSLDASITLDESFTQFLALLSELSPEVLAHELCAIMCDLMFQLGQHLDELVELKWARSNSAEQAPTLQRLAQYFAKVSALTIASILISDTPKQQATIYRLWIRVLQICFDVYKDLNTTAAILAGLTDISVTRLRKFKQFVSDKYQQELAQFDELFAPKNNFKSYRSVQSPSHIPYIAVHLKDLMFLCEGNKKFLSVSGDEDDVPAGESSQPVVINFERIHMMHSFIYGLGIHNLLSTSVPLPTDTKLLRAISKIHAPDLEELYNLSSKRELPPKHILQNQIVELHTQLEYLELQLNHLRQAQATSTALVPAPAATPSDVAASPSENTGTAATDATIVVADDGASTPQRTTDGASENDEPRAPSGAESAGAIVRSSSGFSVVSPRLLSSPTPRSGTSVSLLRQVVELREQVDAFRRQCSEESAQNAELRFQNQSLEEQVKEAHQKIELLENQVVEQAIALAEATSELDELRTDQRKLSAQANSKESDIKIITRQLRTTRTMAETYRTSNERLRDENERLKAQILELMEARDTAAEQEAEDEAEAEMFQRSVVPPALHRATEPPQPHASLAAQHHHRPSFSLALPAQPPPLPTLPPLTPGGSGSIKLLDPLEALSQIEIEFEEALGLVPPGTARARSTLSSSSGGAATAAGAAPEAGVNYNNAASAPSAAAIEQLLEERVSGSLATDSALNSTASSAGDASLSLDVLTLDLESLSLEVPTLVAAPAANAGEPPVRRSSATAVLQLPSLPAPLPADEHPPAVRRQVSMGAPLSVVSQLESVLRDGGGYGSLPLPTALPLSSSSIPTPAPAPPPLPLLPEAPRVGQESYLIRVVLNNTSKVLRFSATSTFEQVREELMTKFHQTIPLESMLSARMFVENQAAPVNTSQTLWAHYGVVASPLPLVLTLRP